MNNHIAIDFGCGGVKLPGFIGIDRFPLPGVDIITDIEQKLPFADNSVDLFHASHSLEHVRDLMPVMKEIYRICKHGTQLCIVAPYSEQKGNWANPYHYQSFNEHSPRFWTNSQVAPLPREQWECPHAKVWGLSGSDYSNQGIDFRCINMEFFYYPEYRHLSEEEKFKARKTLIDVCDVIMYNLVAIKRPVPDQEFEKIKNEIELFIPKHILDRRKADKEGI